MGPNSVNYNRGIFWSMLRFPAVLVAFTSAISAEPVDPIVDASPLWNTAHPAEGHTLWKTALRGGAGPVSTSDDRILVAGATDWTGPAKGGPATNSGAVTCMDASGKLLWQARHPRIGSRIHDLEQPIRSKPFIDGDRAYYVSNRGELVCADLEGFHDGANDGPFQNEDQTGSTNADFLWKIDMMAELGVFRREASDVGNPSSSPIVIGDLVFCVSGHGRTGSGELPYASTPNSPVHQEAPSFLAVQKLTGKIAWSSSAPGRDILLGQWSSPVHAQIRGVDLVIFPGGDGFLYGFEALSGTLLWKVDCNEPGAKNYFVASPVVHESTLYVGLNQDFEQPTPSPLLALDLSAGGGGGAPTVRWKFQAPGFGSTFTAPAIAEGIVYVVGEQSVLFAVDAATGQELWHSRFEDSRTLFASPVVFQRKVYAGGDFTVAVYAAGREKQCLGRYEVSGAYTNTPEFTSDTMILSAGSSLLAVNLPALQ